MSFCMGPAAHRRTPSSPLQVERVQTLGVQRLACSRVGEALFNLRIDGTLPAPRAGARAAIGHGGRPPALVRRQQRAAHRMTGIA